jgi:hypothetical protein
LEHKGEAQRVSALSAGRPFNRFRELDPGRPPQKTRHITFFHVLPAGAGITWNTRSLHSRALTGVGLPAHFFVVPLTESMRAKENQTGVA